MNKSDLTIGEKGNQDLQKRITAWADSLDPNKQRGGQLAASQGVFNRAEGLETLANAFKNNNLPNTQMEELAIGLNGMLSRSNTGAQQQVNALVPKSAVGDVNKLAQWLSNEPRGTGQQAFVKMMLGTIGREKATAADQITRVQLQRTTRNADLEKLAPQVFQTTLQGYGIEPEQWQQFKNGGFKPQSAVQGADGSHGTNDIALTGAKAARLAELRAKAKAGGL